MREQKGVSFTINKAKLADAVLTISPDSYGTTGQPYHAYLYSKARRI